MTKNYFIKLSNYNIWANNIVCSWLEKITNEQWSQHITSSFNSIQETVLHIIGAENIWLERMNKVEKPDWLPSTYQGTKDEHITLLKKTSQELKDFIVAFDENNLLVKLDFKRLNGDAYSMPYYELLAHIFNHSTYHRGQLVTMLRQVGFTDVEATDMLGFFRNYF
ncbi:MAG: DinB family protein [Chitinophagaceae bacterium]